MWFLFRLLIIFNVLDLLIKLYVIYFTAFTFSVILRCNFLLLSLFFLYHRIYSCLFASHCIFTLIEFIASLPVEYST